MRDNRIRIALTPARQANPGLMTNDDLTDDGRGATDDDELCPNADHVASGGNPTLRTRS